MSLVVLRYMASRNWMESQLLAGNPVDTRDQEVSIDLRSLDLRQRVEALADAVLYFEAGKQEFLCVLDSGIDPELSFGPDDQHLVPLDSEIIEQVGALPELSEPTEDIAAIVDAWEQWLEDYKDQALRVIEKLNRKPPALLQAANPFVKKQKWGSVGISFGKGVVGEIEIESGARAVRDARAGRLWVWSARKLFSSDSYAAAKQATDATPSEGRSWLSVLPAEKLAELYLHKKRKLYEVAKAHHYARLSKVPDFDTEMKRWAEDRGSDRLRLGLQDGYRMNARYLAERLAAEAPGMYAMPASVAQDGWAHKAGSPSESALRLRRRVAAAMKRNAPPNLDGKPEAEIVIVKKPPHEIYLADAGAETSSGVIGAGLPRRDGWPWLVRLGGEPEGLGPKPFEAVVVKHWLGKYHLIGAVRSDPGGGPLGIWALPDPDHFGEDGKVHAQDPDAPAPDSAKRKPPEDKDDDIPF